MNQRISKIFAAPEERIKEVIGRLTENKKRDPTLPPGIALIVDKKRRLLGIATNGDLRRAFAAGVKLDDPISKAVNKNPSVLISESGSVNILPHLFEKIKAGEWPKNRLEKILVVDKARRVLDVVSFYDLVHTSDVRFKHIGILGLGYVGLTLGLVLAELGFKVRGFDADKEVMRTLKKGQAHFYEEGLQELLEDNLGKNFVLVDNFNGAANSDIYFISVGTPVGKGLRPDLSHLKEASRSVGKILKPGDAVVLRSTVPLGTTRNVVLPLLEKESRLKGGEDFLLAFAPERTAAGKALEELRRLPQVIGGINHASSDLVSNIFSFLTNSVVLADSLEAAEFVKLINNTYRDVTFGFANEVALISKLWGIDTKKVIEAANYGYERSKVPFPSPGVGGYCLEKDPFIFIASAREKGYEPFLPRYARFISDAIVDDIAEEVLSFLKNHKKGKASSKILSLGLAFKGRPVTSDIRGSTALKLLKKLRDEKFRNIYGYDPAVNRKEIEAEGIKYAAEPEEAFKNADVVLVMNNNPAFETLKIRRLLRLVKSPVFLFDGWSLFNPEEIRKAKGVVYRKL